MNKARVEAVGGTASPIDISTLQQILGERAVVSMCNWPISLHRGSDDAKACGIIADCEAIVLREGWLPAGVFEALQGLLIVVAHGTGVDAIDVEAATANGVLVCNVPGANTAAVAEHVIGLTIGLLRNIVGAGISLALGKGWEASRLLGSEIRGKKVGIIGYGATGQQVAQLFRHFGAAVIATSRSRQPGTEHDGINFVSLDDLLRLSDIVSLHLPLTPLTHHFLDARRLSSLKQTAVLINASRGAVIQEDALLESLRAGKLAGAALDVFSVEPPPNLAEFIALKNLVITPHLGGATKESLHQIAQGAASCIALAFDGIVAEQCLNPEAAASEAWRVRLERWRQPRGSSAGSPLVGNVNSINPA